MTPAVASLVELDTLANAPSETELQKAAYTQDQIRTILETDERLKKYKITTFLHGSYKNRTNVRRESDVDIGVYSPVMYFSKTVGLDDQELLQFRKSWTPSSLTYDQYRADVLAVLQSAYGQSIEDGNKAIRVAGNSTRLPADILPCVEYRRYWRYTGQPSDYTEGISFQDKQTKLHANYPDQHYNRLVLMNGATSGYLKGTIRVWKRLRHSLINAGYLDPKDAPQCYIEGLLSCVPHELFGDGYDTTMRRVLGHLHADLEGVIAGTSTTVYRQANGILKLFHDDFWSAKSALLLVEDFEALLYDI